MDRRGVDVDQVIENIKVDLCQNIVPIQNVIQRDGALLIGDLLESKTMIDDLSLYDDVLLERYLNEETIDKDVLHASLQRLSYSKEHILSAMAVHLKVWAWMDF